jgi:hypothetical protein
MRIRNIVLMSLLLAVVLSGCASMKEIKPSEGMKGMVDLEKKGRETFADTPSVQKEKTHKNLFVVNDPATEIPADKDKDVKAEFSGAETEQILYTVGKVSGLNVIYQPLQNRNTDSQLQQNQTVNQVGVAPPAIGGGYNETTQAQSTTGLQRRHPVSITFNGKLSDFLKTLSKASGYFFLYENGCIVVREVDSFNFSVPSYPELLKEVENSVKSLGGKNIAYDKLSATMSFTCDANSYARIKNFCKNLKANGALVKMRVLLLNVQLTSDKSMGIDWTQITAGYKGQAQPNFGNAAQWATASNSSTTTSATSSGTSSSSSVIAPATGLGAMFNSTGANLFIEGKNFTLGVLANFMEDYGHVEVMQSANVDSMSGGKGHFDDVTENPYVSEISFSALSSQITTPTQAVKTAVAKSGVEVDIAPLYNKEDGTITCTLKVSVLGINSYVILSAGTQIGQITQPQTTKKTIDTTLLMSPTQVAIIGGYVTDQVNESSKGLPTDSLLTKSYSTSKQKSELVVVVKPSVIEFE